MSPNWYLAIIGFEGWNQGKQKIGILKMYAKKQKNKNKTKKQKKHQKHTENIKLKS